MPWIKLGGNLCHILFVFNCYVIVYKTIYMVLKITPLHRGQSLTGHLVVASIIINIGNVRERISHKMRLQFKVNIIQ